MTSPIDTKITGACSAADVVAGAANAATPCSTDPACSASTNSASVAVRNSERSCISLYHAALRLALASELGQPGLFDLIQQRCPYLFAMRALSSCLTNTWHAW
jgi:hypothetical protein